MKPFGRIDWDCFAGAMGDAHIGNFEKDDVDYTIIADENGVEIIWGDYHYARRDMVGVVTNTEFCNILLTSVEKARDIEQLFAFYSIELIQ